MAACCDPLEAPVGETNVTNILSPTAEPPQRWVRLAIALVVAGLSMQVSLGINLTPVSGLTRLLTHGGLALAAAFVVVLLGGPIVRRSWAAARQRRITLEQLFFVGIAGAFAGSVLSSLTGAGAIYYEVVGVLVAVYTLGQMLVERQRSRVRTSLRTLTDSLRTAVRLTCCGKRHSVRVSELAPGDRVLVEKGRRLPVDGTVEEGRAYVQEISHTGEPFPASKSIGDSVLAGSVALDGDLIISVGASNVRELDRLAERLETALTQRSDWLREADRWMTWFVPGVIAIAAGTFGFWLWRGDWAQALFNALAVLLVACPCGLGLGVPIALWHAMHRLARLGIVPAGSELIERLARVRTVIFDKTGTLTEEEIRLHALVTLDGVDASALRNRLALIESHCDHPVARPFSLLLPAQSHSATERVVELLTLPGKGVAARLARPTGEITAIDIGNRCLLNPHHELSLAELRKRSPAEVSAHRELFVFEEGRLIAIAYLAEDLRPAFANLAPRLQGLGLRLGIMTGDASPNEKQWTEAGLNVSSGMTAAEKAAAVREMEMREESVLFVGDGLNDAEAMATATASLAVLDGDSTARAHAHGELAGSSLSALPEAIAVSRATHSTIRLILAISLSYNAIGLLLAATGWLHPIAAAAIMFASSLTVVALAGRGSARER